MTLPAWRPLKDAPRDKVIVVRCKGMRFLSPANDEDRCSHEGATFAPIADTLELDRAVQGEIARAFGALLNALVEDERQRIYAAKDGGDGDCYQLFGRHTIRRFASVLHTSMGGRIPDEVP